MVVVDQGSFVGVVDAPVVPDTGGQGQKALSDTGEYPVRGGRRAFRGRVDPSGSG